jgi:hypothetical protein
MWIIDIYDIVGDKASTAIKTMEGPTEELSLEVFYVGMVGKY